MIFLCSVWFPAGVLYEIGSRVPKVVNTNQLSLYTRGNGRKGDELWATHTLI